ncbi:MAG: 6-pyruvoyl-tetrahydropterin synthase-related protein [Anaerolineae bacterium]
MNLLKRLFHWFDIYLLLTLALCTFTLLPLLARPGLPNGDDVLYHVYRAAEMDRAWSHGVLFPRWAESFYTGYGAPLFHYYASLSYYTTSTFSRLLALDAVNSLRLLIALCMLGAGAGMYGFARATSGKAGGVIAALCYVYCPYLLYTEPYSRGAYPELMAFALFPAVMWCYSRLLRTGKASAFGLAALGSGLLIITHNLMALVLTGLLEGWLVWGVVVNSYQWLVISKRQKDNPEPPPHPSPASEGGGRTEHSLTLWRHGLALLAAGLGVGLAAYFWLPVIREGDAVRLGNLTAVAQLDYRNFFVPLNHLLEFSPRMDAGAFNGLEHQFNLGVAQWTLALAGVAGMAGLWCGTKRTSRTTSLQNAVPVGQQSSILSTTLFFSLVALVTIFLMLPAAAPIWGGTAPLAFLQFPWRFLGAASFALAVLAGMNAVWLEALVIRIAKAGAQTGAPLQFIRNYVGDILLAGMVVYIITCAAPLFYVPEWIHATVDTSVAAYQEAEVQGLQRATTFSNEYLPKAVTIEPGPTPRLLADFADGYPINKVHMETLPPDVIVDVVNHEPQQDEWHINTSKDFTLEVLTYDWPGWTATVDGQNVAITPSDPHGLITFPVPAGEHTVRLYLGSTSPRDVGVLLTLVSVVGVAGVIVVLRRRTGGVETRPYTASTYSHNVTGLVIGGLLTAAFLFVYLQEGAGWVNSPPGTALLAQHATNYQLGDRIRLIGYDLNAEAFHAGERVELKVYWYTSDKISYGYNSFVHISTGGPPLAQADKLNPAGLPTVTWPSTGFIHDDYTIDLPRDMPTGEYQVFIGLYTCDTRPAGECGNGERLVVTEDGQAVGDAVPLARITVR